MDKIFDLTVLYAPQLLHPKQSRLGTLAEEWESRHHRRASICLAGCNNASRGLMRLLIQKYDFEEVCARCRCFCDRSPALERGRSARNGRTDAHTTLGAHGAIALARFA
jgi:hypothetical protein